MNKLNESVSDRLERSTLRLRDDECWMWTGSRNAQGYGQFSHRDGKFFVHRLAYVLHYGPYESRVEGRRICVCHKCDNRCCVNPAHLFLGTQSDNMKDCVRKGRISPLIKQNIERGRVNENARAARRAVREASIVAGVPIVAVDSFGKKRDEFGRYSDGSTRLADRSRDAFGRMVRSGQDLPARKRDSRGYFIKS